MAVHTIMMDFTIKANTPGDSEERQNLINTLESALSSYVKDIKILQTTEVVDGFIVFFLGYKGTLVTARAFEKGVLTVNVEFYKPADEDPLMNFEVVKKIEGVIRESLRSQWSHKYPPFKRADKVNKYFVTSDERLLEYDTDALLYEEKSPFQKIQIFHSRSCGNFLVLDDLQNLSDADLVYTETLMQRGKENYEGKEILILGGGDGALLWELLKEKPKFVTMIDIDELVIKACRIHMRKSCGDCLDNYDGPNYKIIVNDCVKIMDQYIGEGRDFDYVFGDLTDVPISPTPQGAHWDFIRLILEKSFKVIRPTGKYMTHVNGSCSPSSIQMYVDQLKKLSVEVEYSSDHAFVPSFLEDWVFLQVWKKQSQKEKVPN
ncbi:spermine synthase isoform X1 [Ischnura elegans]|uniref:spermine synthase isoform X1 n=1 Tax=Ischnura elegans TaxID=197161 RepID=UPI001ED8915E|nr:spermine synthase isoform X1 [Ischnura elegans]